MHAFRLAASTADRLGLELAIAGSLGWSETGGPWAPPTDDMKKLVWSETDIAGGRCYAGRLVAPLGVTGPFQSLPFDDPLSALEGRLAPPPPCLYADVAMLAYPVAAAIDVPPVVTVGDAPVDATALADDRVDTKVAVAKAGATLVFTIRAPR